VHWLSLSKCLKLVVVRARFWAFQSAPSTSPAPAQLQDCPARAPWSPSLATEHTDRAAHTCDGGPKRTHACMRTHTHHTRQNRERARAWRTHHTGNWLLRARLHGVLPPAAAGSGRSFYRDQRLGIDLIDREVDDVVVDDLRLAERHRRFEQLLALASEEDVGGDEHR
jgi:hypothetical protein